VVLDRLEQKGVVSSRLADPTEKRGGHPRRWYAIENAGLAALEETRRVNERLWAALPVLIGGGA
jgi:DNA-binding PadR family transcriptional regulator